MGGARHQRLAAGGEADAPAGVQLSMAHGGDGHDEACSLCATSAAAASAAAASATTPGVLRPGNEMVDLLGQAGIQLPEPAPDRAEGEGPFARLILRGATVIDGTGAPPFGPVDIVIENDRIVEVRTVGFPKLAIDPARRPKGGDKEIDASGCWVLPGFVDSHAHISFPRRNSFGPPPPAEYVYKLWLAHGVTSVREVGSINGLQWTVSESERSRTNAITAPRIHPYALFPLKEFIHLDADQARSWVGAVKAAGAVGVKYLNATHESMAVVLAEAKALGLPTACHHSQLSVTRMNTLQSARLGLTTAEHWYGLPEALFEDRTIQDYPADYNYSDEQDRFREAGRLWVQAAAPGSAKWNAVIDEMVGLGLTLVPTFTIYEATRDEMRARSADWHADYTWPPLWDYFQPNREAMGAFFYHWTTADEVAWRENYRRWMTFINDYKNKGGRVCAGADSGFIYNTFGFGYIRELELLQEAGFHPLEVIRAATEAGAQVLGAAADIGTVETGKKADLVIVDENPLANFKVLYGTGAVRLNDETGVPERVGGVKWTIKDGIVFDARELLADVRRMNDAVR
jgi:imidazolonepropionase-like amidohydrolase